MSLQSHIRFTDVRSRLTRMLRPIKDVDLPHHGLGSDDVWILWHVSSFVDFAIVVDRLNDFDPRFCPAVLSNFYPPHPKQDESVLDPAKLQIVPRSPRCLTARTTHAPCFP